MIRILACVGTFNTEGGKWSKLADAFLEGIIDGIDVDNDMLRLNGGYVHQMYDAVERIAETKPDIVIWMPNIPNTVPKRVTDIKKRHPHCLLVTSKRTDNRDITLPDIIARSLSVKANLTLVINTIGDRFGGALIDPLGNQWCDSSDFEELGRAAGRRLQQLRGYTRIGSQYVGGTFGICFDDPKFLEVVKEFGQAFAEIIPTSKETDRFLGNASFRCSHGFPAMRDRNSHAIWVSRRNVDKTGINMGDFVLCGPDLMNDGDGNLHDRTAARALSIPVQLVEAARRYYTDPTYNDPEWDQAAAVYEAQGVVVPAPQYLWAMRGMAKKVRLAKIYGMTSVLEECDGPFVDAVDSLECRPAVRYAHGDPAIKPSVDAPVIVRLMGVAKNVEWLIHGHCYIDGAPFTDEAVSCGAMEEATEVLKVLRDPDKIGPASSYSVGSLIGDAVNLRGHGCLIMVGRDPREEEAPYRYMRSLLPRLIPRPQPEPQYLAEPYERVKSKMEEE